MSSFWKSFSASFAKFPLEQRTIGVLLFIAMFTFFSPLLRLHGPDGDLSGTGHDVRSALALMRTSLSVVDSYKSTPGQEAGYHAVSEKLTDEGRLALPWSLKYAQLPPWMMFAAMICAGLALIDLVIARKLVPELSLLGGCFSVGAMLQANLMGAGLKAWSQALINSGALSSSGSALFLTRMLLVNSFQVSPGPGLYVLTFCMVLVPFLSYTHSIPRIRSVIRRDRRIKMCLPIRIRPVAGQRPEEICNSVDISRSGVLVETASSYYYVGMETYVTRTATGAEEHASVVRVEKRKDGKYRVALRILTVA